MFWTMIQKKWVTIFFTFTPAKITHRPMIGNANNTNALNVYVYLKLWYYSPFEALKLNKLTNILKTPNSHTCWKRHDSRLRFSLFQLKSFPQDGGSEIVISIIALVFVPQSKLETMLFGPFVVWMWRYCLLNNNLVWPLPRLALTLALVILGGLSINLNHLIAYWLANYNWPFGTLPFGFFVKFGHKGP